MRTFQLKTEPKKNPGAWDSTVVSIFEDGERLGSYERLHFGFSETTFFPFERDERWYALFSADYTCSRVMSLPDCQDLGGEEPDNHGFCPVEFYVPRYRTVSWTDSKTVRTYDWRQFDNRKPDPPSPEEPNYRYGPWRFLQTGFVAGCVWGDDSSWKIEVLDLSQASDGVLARSARFGHCELPQKRSLKECLDFGYWEPDSPRVLITRQEMRDLSSGAVIDPYDYL